MNSDTLYRLAGIFGEIEKLLIREATDISDKEAQSSRLSVIRRAADLADRMMIKNDVAADAAISSAAARFCLPVTPVQLEIERREKADLSARLQGAEIKRRKGASLRTIENDFRIPKSTLADRLKPAPNKTPNSRR